MSPNILVPQANIILVQHYIHILFTNLKMYNLYFCGVTLINFEILVNYLLDIVKQFPLT